MAALYWSEEVDFSHFLKSYALDVHYYPSLLAAVLLISPPPDSAFPFVSADIGNSTLASILGSATSQLKSSYLERVHTSHGTIATPASLTSTVSGRPEHFNFLVRQASHARAVIARFP
jgi:hypothetical protein